MKILALEFSSDRRSVAVLDGGRVRARAEQSGARTGGVLGLVESTLRQAGLEREQVDCLAVGLGPGSYTGIRTAIALAQGWQLALGTRTLGLSSLESLAAAAHLERIWGRVNLVVDAQRDELYLAGYEIEAAGWREIEPLRLARIDEVRARANAGEPIVGPDAARWFSAGRVLFPEAELIGQLAAARSDFVPCQRLEPIYLRQTDFVKAPPPGGIPAQSKGHRQAGGLKP